MICSTLPELLDDDAAWQCVQAGIPAHRRPAHRAGLRGRDARRARRSGPAARDRATAPRPAESSSSARRAEWLSEHDAKELLRAAGVDVVDGRLVADAADAVAALGQLGGHIALKLSSAAVQHKSELGAVWLGLSSEAEVAAAFGAALARSSAPRRRGAGRADGRRLASS